MTTIQTYEPREVPFASWILRVSRKARSTTWSLVKTRSYGRFCSAFRIGACHFSGRSSRQVCAALRRILDRWRPSATFRLSAPTWLRNLGFSSWLLVGFVLIIIGLIWLLAETSTIVMPVILAAVLGAVAGPLGRLAGAPQGSAHRRRDPRAARARRHRRADLLPRLRRHIRPTRATSRRRSNQALDKIQGWLSDLGIDNPQSAKEDVAEGRARDPHDAAERGRGGHRGPEVAGVLPCFRDAQHAVRAQGRAGHAPLHQPAPGRARTGRPTSSRPTSPSRCAATSSP